MQRQNYKISCLLIALWSVVGREAPLQPYEASPLYQERPYRFFVFFSTSCEYSILPKAAATCCITIFVTLIFYLSEHLCERNICGEKEGILSARICCLLIGTQIFHKFTFWIKICEYFQRDKVVHSDSLHARLGAKCKHLCFTRPGDKCLSSFEIVIFIVKCLVTHRNQSLHAAHFLLFRPFHSLQVHGFNSLHTLTHSFIRSLQPVVWMWFIYTAAHSFSRSGTHCENAKKKAKKDKWKINEYANGRLTFEQNAFTHLECHKRTCRFAHATASGKRAAIWLTISFDREWGTRGEEATDNGSSNSKANRVRYVYINGWLLFIYYIENGALATHTRNGDRAFSHTRCVCVCALLL